MEADFEQVWVNFRPILNNFGSIFGQFMQKMAISSRQKRSPILNNFWPIFGQFLSKNGHFFKAKKEPNFETFWANFWPISFQKCTFLRPKTWRPILNNFGSIFGQFLSKNGHFLGPKHGGRFWTSLGQFSANLEQFWVNFWPIYAKNWPIIFQAKKEADFEQLWVNFWPILNKWAKKRSIFGQFWINGPKKSQFLANLCKKWPSLRRPILNTVEEIASYVDIQYILKVFDWKGSIESVRLKAFNWQRSIESVWSKVFDRKRSIKSVWVWSKAFNRKPSIKIGCPHNWQFLPLCIRKQLTNLSFVYDAFLCSTWWWLSKVNSVGDAKKSQAF